MSDETPKKPTHLLNVVLEGGVSVGPISFTEDIAPDDSFVYEGIADEDPKFLILRKRDGTSAYFDRKRILYYSIQPWKELPPLLKERLEQAKAAPSKFGPN